jgi:uncharacterized membrane protein
LEQEVNSQSVEAISQAVEKPGEKPMNDVTVAALLFAAVGVLYIGFGIPLLKGRVQPNRWYGWRTKKTLSDARVWYAVNEIAGRDLIWTGVVVLVNSLIVFLLRNSISTTNARILLLLVFVTSVGFMVVNGLRAQRQM